MIFILFWRCQRARWSGYTFEESVVLATLLQKLSSSYCFSSNLSLIAFSCSLEGASCNCSRSWAVRCLVSYSFSSYCALLLESCRRMGSAASQYPMDWSYSAMDWSMLILSEMCFVFP